MRAPYLIYGGIAGATVLVVAVLGFRGQLSKNPPWHVFWDMKYQQKYTPQAETRFFADGRTMRPLLPGTIAYAGSNYACDAGMLRHSNEELLRANDAVYRGIGSPPEVDVVYEDIVEIPDPGDPKKKLQQKTMKTRREPNWVKHIPDEVLLHFGGKNPQGWKALLDRGAERYKINCLPCHGGAGNGLGITAEYGMQGIASYHQDRLREAPDGYLFDVITNGKQTMSAYGHQVKPMDRWAIVAYLRVLQHAQAPSPLLTVKQP